MNQPVSEIVSQLFMKHEIGSAITNYMISLALSQKVREYMCQYQIENICVFGETTDIPIKSIVEVVYEGVYFIQLEQVLQKNCVDVEKHDDEVSIISYTYEMIFKKMILTGCENVGIGNEGQCEQRLTWKFIGTGSSVFINKGRQLSFELTREFWKSLTIKLYSAQKLTKEFC